MAMNYLKKLARIMFGLSLFAFGLYLNIQANIGLAPWSAFAMGISNTTGILYGNASVIIGIVLIAADIILKEKIGIGSILNGVLIGKIVDLLSWIDVVPVIENYFVGILVLLLGQFLVAVGSYFYMSAELGAGPRDSFMVALGKRLKKIPIGVVRGIIEATVTLVGWLLGAKIGLGTVLSVVAISFFIQLVFKIFRYDPKSVRHESIVDTYKVIFRKGKKAAE